MSEVLQPGDALQVEAYRHSTPEHADIGPGLIEGSRSVGGRMNPAGEFGTLYLSLERNTAVAELRRKAERAGVRLEELLPRVVSTVEVELHRVLDLTRKDTRREWGVTLEDLADTNYDACQDVARAARRAGYEAILFPSAPGPGTNLAVFLDRLHPGSRVERIETDRVDPGDRQ